MDKLPSDSFLRTSGKPSKELALAEAIYTAYRSELSESVLQNLQYFRAELRPRIVVDFAADFRDLSESSHAKEVHQKVYSYIEFFIRTRL